MDQTFPVEFSIWTYDLLHGVIEPKRWISSNNMSYEMFRLRCGQVFWLLADIKYIYSESINVWSIDKQGVIVESMQIHTFMHLVKTRCVCQIMNISCTYYIHSKYYCIACVCVCVCVCLYYSCMHVDLRWSHVCLSNSSRKTNGHHVKLWVSSVCVVYIIHHLRWCQGCWSRLR